MVAQQTDGFGGVDGATAPYRHNAVDAVLFGVGGAGDDGRLTRVGFDGGGLHDGQPGGAEGGGDGLAGGCFGQKGVNQEQYRLHAQITGFATDGGDDPGPTHNPGGTELCLNHVYIPLCV